MNENENFIETYSIERFNELIDFCNGNKPNGNKPNGKFKLLFDINYDDYDTDLANTTYIILMDNVVLIELNKNINVKLNIVHFTDTLLYFILNDKQIRSIKISRLLKR